MPITGKIMRITVIRFFFCLRRTRMTMNEPRITHELLFMEHYMGHYMWITCSVADKIFLPSANTNYREWTTNYSWIIIWNITCGLHVASQTRIIYEKFVFNSCGVADKNSFVWDWKELARIRKNSAQELEIFFL